MAPGNSVADPGAVGNTRGMFSARSGGPSEKNALASALQTLREAAVSITDLTVSNPHEAELPYDAAGIPRALGSAATLGYVPTAFGLPSARRVLRARYREAGISVDEDQIVLTASTSEAYAFLFTLLCDPGDEVLIPAPSYPLFDYLAQFSGVRAVRYPLAYDGAWHVEPSALHRAIGERTRAIIVVNPNNPTGSYTSGAEWQGLADLGLPIIADEVFAHYALGKPPEPTSVLHAIAAPKAPIFSLDGLSKLAGLPGLKLSWLVFRSPPGLEAELRHRLELIADTFLSVATPVQVALPDLLRCAAVTHEAIRERLHHNHALLKQALADTAATLLRVEGGWYAVVRLPHIASEQTWVLDLLLERHVLVQPGWFYDFADEPYIVLSLLTPSAPFARGVNAVRQALDAHSPWKPSQK